MNCYITRTGSYLPGAAVDNKNMCQFIGNLDGETEIRDKILRMNGIKQRYYALNNQQKATHDVYELASLAAVECIQNFNEKSSIGYLSAGTTNAPLVAPGLASILHSRLALKKLINASLEINSNSGICTSGSQSIVNACRAVDNGYHDSALCVGVDQPSEILKSSVIKVPSDRESHEDIKNSKWFMSVFLRFMLSDGAGAFLIQNKPNPEGISFKVNWTYSESFAHEAPLCMKLESRSLLLSQDVNILNRFMGLPRHSAANALKRYNENLTDYKIILPHLSSFFFRRLITKTIRELGTSSDGKVDYWTNLEYAGNTGAASIFIMLDEYAKNNNLKNGDKILLFIPESGQFNFVYISLTLTK